MLLVNVLFFKFLFIVREIANQKYGPGKFTYSLTGSLNTTPIK